MSVLDVVYGSIELLREFQLKTLNEDVVNGANCK